MRVNGIDYGPQLVRDSVTRRTVDEMIRRGLVAAKPSHMASSGQLPSGAWTATKDAPRASRIMAAWNAKTKSDGDAGAAKAEIFWRHQGARL
jgi:hypothetical protein